jgi:hypothetical protein
LWLLRIWNPGGRYVELNLGRRDKYMPFDPSQFKIHEVLVNEKTREIRIVYIYKFFFFVVKMFNDDGTGYSVKIFIREVNYRKFKSYWNTNVAVDNPIEIGYLDRRAIKILYNYNEVLRL